MVIGDLPACLQTSARGAWLRHDSCQEIFCSRSGGIRGRS
jgi:hypothetical protein